MSAGNINPADWEALDEECSDWRSSEGIRWEEQRVERTAMGREERVKTVKIPCPHSQEHLSPKTQQSLPIQAGAATRPLTKS